jgi:sugar phosphate isomerase/epimerase
MQRRKFIQQAGMLSAISMIGPQHLFAAPASIKAGIQLYSMRDYITKDVRGVLAKVAKAGYKEVETYGYSKSSGFWGLSAKEFKAVLAANGLTTPSGHYDMDSFVRTGSQDVLMSYIEAAKASGQTYIIVPSLNDNLRTTPDEFKAVADKLNKAGELCKAAGLRLGYHNHDFEFKAIGGTTFYDVLLKETQPGLVDFEMDIYWVVRAGQDPVKMIQEHPGRFPLWHVKDMDKAKPELNTEIGSGSIDFAKIFALSNTAGLKHLLMEQENFSMDAYKSITQSATYMNKKLIPQLKRA